MLNSEPLSKAERVELMSFLREAEETERRENRAIQARPRGLIEFVRYFWDVLEPFTEFVDGWAFEAICLHLEAVTFGHITRLLINVPPGFCKSLLTDVLWPAWEWSAMDMAGNRIVSFSYSSPITEYNNSKFRDLLVSDKFRTLWGHRFKLTEDGKIRVTNSATGWKFASSVGGTGTGIRGDRVIFDDPHNVKESESDPIRMETTRWFREGMSNRLNSVTDSAIVVIMQRVHEEDVSGVILREYPEYEFLCIPMAYDPSRARTTSIGWSDPRSEPGELAWPERFPDSHLEQYRRNKYAWASQYQQTPFIRGGAIIQDTWWRLWDDEEAVAQGGKPGRFPAFEYVLACYDGAFTEKTENDPCAMTVWGMWVDRTETKTLKAPRLDGSVQLIPDIQETRRFMLIYAWSEHLSFNPSVLKIAEVARRYKVDRLLIENKATGISVAQELRRLYANEEWAVHLVDPKGLDKVTRANSVSHLWEVGLVYAPNTKWAQMVIEQCASFPKGKHDDLVDTCVMALSHFRSNGMAVMPDERQYYVEQEMTHRKVDRRALYPG